jgi:hypothetical protein
MQDNNVYMKLPGRLPTRMKQLFFALVFGAALIAPAGACSSRFPDEATGGGPPCLPPSYSVSPSSARPGEKVTVAAPAADCNPRYGGNARIAVGVTDARGNKVINATAPMTDSGEFTYTFTVPAEIAVGQATVTAMPHNIDWCDDTGRNNRAEGHVNFERASCAEPVKPLTITP